MKLAEALRRATRGGDRRLKLDHVPVAIALGIGAGMITTILTFALAAIIIDPSLVLAAPVGALLMLVLGFPIFGAAWGLGVLLVGCPAWLILHRLRLQGWVAAAALGAVLSVCGVFVLAGWGGWGHLAVALAGAASGLTVWSVAYQKPDGSLKKGQI